MTPSPHRERPHAQPTSVRNPETSSEAAPPGSFRLTPPSPTEAQPPARTLNRQAVWHRTRHYAGATYLSRALCVIRGVINARCLGPELYGFWGSLTFLLSFGFHLHGGVQDIAAKEIPMHRSHGRVDLARATAQRAFTFFVLALSVASVLLWLVAWRLPVGTPGLLRAGWAVAGIVLPLEVLWLFEQTVAKAEERFGRLSRSLVIASALSLALTGWLVVSHGLAGLFIVAVATPSVGLWYLHRRAGYSWTIAWSWAQLLRMLKSGWPVLSMTLIFESLSWIDRALVLGVVGVSGLGYYSLAIMLAQLCGLLPSVLAEVVEPRLYADYAERQQAGGVWDHLWFPLRTLACLMPIGVAGVDLVLPMVVERWLPSYAPGVTAMRVLVWGSVFAGLSMCTKSFIVALGAQREALPWHLLAIVVNVLVSGGLALGGFGLTGIALGTSVAYGVCCTGLLWFAFRRLGRPAGWILGRIGLLYVPFCAVAGSTLVVPWLVGKALPAWASGVPLINAVAAIGSCSAVLGYLWWRGLAAPISGSSEP